MTGVLLLVAAITTLVALVGVVIVAAALRRLARDVHREARGDRAAGAGELDAKKALIDQSLAQVARRIAEFERTMREIDGQRREQYGALAASVRSLSRTTQELHEALASARVRGQWGERMAEDVLRVAGFVEGVNYRKQKAIANGTIPDFTFLLPNDLALHMDVKFPLDNYMRYVRAANDIEREQHRRAFLRDVRERVKELTGRGYLDDRTHTVECLLLFVPNEGLFAFVQEHDPALLDDALARGIVVCSPLTLFAILRVIRQAIDHFRLERTAGEILTLLGEFEGQWTKYNEKLEKVQRSFQTAQRDLDELATTRTRQLQRPLDRIAALRRDHDASGELDLTTRPAAVGAPRRLR